ncbi:MAG: hypothetical protein KIT22_17075 [Verrucomicrobiae bacterium]|nr:hypothetical protein [Verrucomicrobiae bacterium]
MKSRFLLFRRGATYYCEDTTTSASQSPVVNGASPIPSSIQRGQRCGSALRCNHDLTRNDSDPPRMDANERQSEAPLNGLRLSPPIPLDPLLPLLGSRSLAPTSFTS